MKDLTTRPVKANKNLATTNQADITILDNGDAFISQTKVAELCGVAKQSIQKGVQSSTFGCQLNLNTINQLSSESAFSVVSYYAQKGQPQAIKSLIAIGAAGMKAYIYHEAGYTMDAKEVKPLSPMEMVIASAQAIMRIEQEQKELADRVKVLESKQSESATGFYSVLGYANLNKQKLTTSDAARIGKLATQASKDAGIKTGSVPDARYGSVKTYHEDVLQEVFDDEFGLDKAA